MGLSIEEELELLALEEEQIRLEMEMSRAAPIQEEAPKGKDLADMSMSELGDHAGSMLQSFAHEGTVGLSDDLSAILSMGGELLPDEVPEQLAFLPQVQALYGIVDLMKWAHGLPMDKKF